MLNDNLNNCNAMIRYLNQRKSYGWAVGLFIFKSRFGGLKVHQINEFIFKMYKFSYILLPLDPPRGTEIHLQKYCG